MATAALTHDSLNARIQSVPGLRQGLLLLGLALAIASGIWLFFWSQKPGHVALYSGLADRDAAEVTEALRASGVPYRIDPTTGAITVPHDNVHEARMRLAAQGLPSGGSRVGIEAIQGDQGFGVSQFVEGARYQHALETELARTISTLRPVRDARVHLALPKPSAFARAREPAGASVVVDLLPGRQLEPNQVNAIVNLVASSISELSPDRVTVVDQGGRLLSQTDPDSDEAHSNRQFEQVRRLETTYMQRVRELLEPFTGRDRTSVQVTVDMDFSAVEEARETYNNDPARVRSEQTSETVRRDNGPVGVPGATANTPPGEEMANAEDSTTTQRSATRNFELDRTLTHTRQPAGRVRRVSAAVLVDHIPGVDAEGAPVMRPLSEDELGRLEALVREAVGFDAARGDSVSVMNAPFVRESAEPVAEVGEPLWQQPWLRDVLRLLGGAAVLLALVFGVLRPLLNQLVGPTPARRQSAEEPARQLGGPEAFDGEARELANEEPEPELSLPPSTYEKRVEFARKAVNEDPKRVAQVVKAWVGNDG